MSSGAQSSSDTAQLPGVEYVNPVTSVLRVLEPQLAYWKSLHAILEDVSKSDISYQEIPDRVRNLLRNSPAGNPIRQAINNTISVYARSIEKHESMNIDPPLTKAEKIIEKLEHVQTTKNQFRVACLERINKLVIKQKRSLIRKRAKIQTEENAKSEADEPTQTGIFEYADIQTALLSITNQNRVQFITPGWGLIKLELRTPLYRELQARYIELSPQYRQQGLDDERNLSYKQERILLCQRVIAYCSQPLAQHFARRGCPTAQRAQIWSIALGCTASDEFRIRYANLKDEVSTIDLIIDAMVTSDVSEVCNDDDYFVFEDVLREVMLCFFRDRNLWQECPLSLSAPVSVDAGGHVAGPFPPNGIIPYCGVSRYCLPICYIHESPSDVYSMFREMYIRYFHRLHAISAQPDSLLFLGKLFEDLAQYLAPHAYHHAVNLGVHPLLIMMPLMSTCFIRCFPPDQILHLFDRIVGYDSLEILALVGAALFVFRARSVMKCTTATEVKEAFEDARKIQIIPLLQYFLFTDRNL